jgi:hypothetical protein
MIPPKTSEPGQAFRGKGANDLIRASVEALARYGFLALTVFWPIFNERLALGQEKGNK